MVLFSYGSQEKRTVPFSSHFFSLTPEHRFPLFKEGRKAFNLVFRPKAGCHVAELDILAHINADISAGADGGSAHDAHPGSGAAGHQPHCGV